MVPSYILSNIQRDDEQYARVNRKEFKVPVYNSRTYYKDVAQRPYFAALITMRHYIKAISDYYFGVVCRAKNVDLFMLTPSISSPMGPGSDSEAIPIMFGNMESYLVDSSQFGFEPLLLNSMEKVYCYLPSMRGENPDKRHLNQFFHCEAEIKGTLDDVIVMVEGYIEMLSEALLLMNNIVKKIAVDPHKTSACLRNIINTPCFPQIEFDDALQILKQNGEGDVIRTTPYGRDITAHGEIELARILQAKTPFWIRNFDRDRVPFYQKPSSTNPNKVINADLLFPPITNGAFGGEIVGSGQRQDNAKEMVESLKRQNINPGPYQWYIDLRKLPYYATTSGFGLGIERYIAWSLGRDDIKDVILYPRLKNVNSLP